MNKHLNLFNSYSKADRNYQLENDLTRALAICLQEDNLLLHEILKQIFSGTNFYNQKFDEYSKDNKVNIEIQKEVSSLEDFEHIFAVSLTSSVMNIEDFFSKEHHAVYDPVCDLVITLNNVIIIIEVKRDNTDCTAQLYNQIFNALKDTGIKNITENEPVTPVDLNWYKLMEIAVNVNNFHKTTNIKNRFLKDFIQYIREHNYSWLPEVSISSLYPNSKNAIFRRIKTAVTNSNIKNLDNDRLGFKYPRPFADEIIFKILDNGDLSISIYPANTKSQGKHIFQNNGTKQFSEEISIDGKIYKLNKVCHIKFTSFQKYFEGLWFDDTDLKVELYNYKNFLQYSGRKKRDKDWLELEALFNNSFYSTYKWKEYCNWESKIINSGKSQFDISFGYELSFEIPFNTLKQIDTKKEDITNLKIVLEEIHKQLQSILK
jgi:hypothetical protein